jgi:hypothetical protein
MSTRLLTLALVLATLSAVSPAQEPKAVDERPLIEQAARDYVEGWYTADAARMERALHPDLMKRYVVDVAPGRQMLRNVTRDNMVEMTRAGGGSKTPPDSRNISVKILEVSGDIAVAAASSSEFYDYLSLAKSNGRWVIVNVLWRLQKPPAPPRR